MKRTRLALLAASVVPLLLSIMYTSQCSDGREGFVLSIRVGHVHVTATRCAS